MAYRKLLTQKTYDELKRLDNECLGLSIELGDEETKIDFRVSIILGGDEQVRYKIEVDVNGMPRYHTLYGKTYEEISNSLLSFRKGLTI